MSVEAKTAAGNEKTEGSEVNKQRQNDFDFHCFELMKRLPSTLIRCSITS